MKPLVTMGIACHNAEKTIVRAISSALNQQWENMEILVVDDCSSDDSWEVLQQVATLDNRVRVYRNSLNQGVAETRNEIIRLAEGDFICFSDDDDVSHPARVDLQLKRILDYEQKHGPLLVMCYCNRHVTTDGSDLKLAPPPIGSKPPEPRGLPVVDFILGLPAPQHIGVWGLMGAGTMMTRKSTLLSVGMFDQAFRRAEEQDLAIRAAKMGAHFISVDQPLLTQYKTIGDEKSGTKPLYFALKLREKHRAYLAERNLYMASRMFARSSFWSNRKRKLLARLYRALGYALAPQLIPSYFRRRFRSRL